MGKKLEGVIFDWAGTTVDYGCFAPVNVFVNIFNVKNIDVTLEEAREPMGMLKRDHVKAMLSMERINGLFLKKFGREWDESDVDAIYADFEKQLFSILENYTTPVPGVLELMKKLRDRGLKIGSTTGYTKEMASIVKAGAKAKGYEPEYIIAANEVSKGRPYPYMVFDNMEALELSNVRRVVKVGDTISDIKEAVNAGVWSVGILKGGSELGLTQEEVETMNEAELAEKMELVRIKMKRAGADYVIDEIGKLEVALDDIEKRLIGKDI